jgi:hypothetical protein
VSCTERERLSILNNLAIRVSIDADKAWLSAAEIVGPSEYNRLQAVANEARIEAEITRLELDQHIRQHNCGIEVT